MICSFNGYYVFGGIKFVLSMLLSAVCSQPTYFFFAHPLLSHQNSRLVCGDETGQASLYDVSDGEGGGRGCSWAAHEARLRAVTAASRSQRVTWLVTASSDGWIKVWQTDTVGVDRFGWLLMMWCEFAVKNVIL